MPGRNRAYIILTILFAAAAVFIIAWILMPEDSSVTEVADSMNQEDQRADRITRSRAADLIESENAGLPDGEENHSLVMQLLKSYQSREIFGAFRIISIIEHETDPQSSRATIEDLQTGSSRTYSINDILPDDSRLAGIKQHYLVLEKSGVRKRLYFGSSDEKIFTGNRTGFRKINDGEFDLNPYRVFRGDASRTLDFTMKVQSRDGDMEGIQVSDIENNPLFRALGLREGDVLVEVNGKPVDSLLNSVKACINTYYSDDVQLKIRRNGKTIDRTYHLFWQGQGSWTPMEVLNSRAISSLFNGEFASHLF